MADWSQLPPELLTLISKCLDTRFAVLRFRSVCSSWRSSIPPKLYPLPRYLPSESKGRFDYSLSHITRNTFYLVRLPGVQHNQTSDPGGCWVVKIRDGTDRVGMRLLNPLSDSELKPFPVNFPKVLDLTSFQVIELGHEFVGRYDIYIDHPLETQYREKRRKVAMMWSDSGDFMMLSLFRGPDEYLAFLRSGEKEWTFVENVDNVQDIISFDGKFYAIEREGRTIVVDQSLHVRFLELVGSPNSRKLLVQSGDNLLAVEMIFVTSSNSDAGNPVCNSFVGDKVAGFRIFSLDKEEKKWDEMESLGARILFLGLRQAISVSASEFSWRKGNLIFFSTDGDRVMFVFDLENGSTSPLQNCPAYFNLFWPPPEWATSTLPKVECKASHSVVFSPESVISSRETVSNSTHTLTSATADAQNQFPGSNSAISTRKVGGICPERIPYAGPEIGSKRHPPSSKLRFKFCCS